MAPATDMRLRAYNSRCLPSDGWLYCSDSLWSAWGGFNSRSRTAASARTGSSSPTRSQSRRRKSSVGSRSVVTRGAAAAAAVISPGTTSKISLRRLIRATRATAEELPNPSLRDVAIRVVQDIEATAGPRRVRRVAKGGAKAKKGKRVKRGRRAAAAANEEEEEEEWEDGNAVDDDEGEEEQEEEEEEQQPQDGGTTCQRACCEFLCDGCVCVCVNT